MLFCPLCTGCYGSVWDRPASGRWERRRVCSGVTGPLLAGLKAGHWIVLDEVKMNGNLFQSLFLYRIDNSKTSLYISWVTLMIVVFLPLISTAKSGLSVCAGRSERLLWPSCWDLHPWAGHALPRSAWEDQDFWLPKPFHTGRRTQRPSQVLP